MNSRLPPATLPCHLTWSQPRRAHHATAVAPVSPHLIFCLCLKTPAYNMPQWRPSHGQRWTVRREKSVVERACHWPVTCPHAAEPTPATSPLPLRPRQDSLRLAQACCQVMGGAHDRCRSSEEDCDCLADSIPHCPLALCLVLAHRARLHWFTCKSFEAARALQRCVSFT